MTPAFLETAISRHCFFASVRLVALPYGRVDVRVSLPWWQCATVGQRDAATLTITGLLLRLGEPPRRYRVTVAAPSWAKAAVDVAFVGSVAVGLWIALRVVQ